MLAMLEQNVSKRLRGEMHLDDREARLVEAVTRRLDLLPARGPTADLFDAIRPCIPLAAGLFSIIPPSALDTMATRTVRLPAEVVESWLGTSPEQLTRTLEPIVSSSAGAMWRDSETLTPAQREKLEVLRKLDGAGLGEGAGYKVLERVIPGRGVEHFMLALLMERGELVPERSRAMLAALNPAIRAAVLRIDLMLLAREPVLVQILADQSIGYVCLSPRGDFLEANRRAHQLVARYQDIVGVVGRRKAMADFATRAREETGDRRSWYIRAVEPTTMLEVSAHHLAKETHAVPEDVVLVMMKEIFIPPVAAPLELHPLLAPLTPTQRKVAVLIVRCRGSYKEIAAQHGMKERTLNKHAEAIFEAFKVHSRIELIELFR